MKPMNIGNLSALLGTAVAIAALAAPATSEAATIASKWKSNAAGICQSAFSSGAGAVIRARPMAVQNEGAINAFVTCSFPYNDEADELPSGPAGLGVRIVNNTPVGTSVTCTLVAGTPPSTPEFVVKSEVIPGNGSFIIRFLPTDLAGGAETVIPAPNVSCGLPPDTGVGNVFYYYDRQIGA